jgi:ribosomal protein S18 acetylase RimI-like enzyme
MPQRPDEVFARERLEMPVEVRFCRAADLEQLEWFGAFRDHRRAIQHAFQRQLRGENWMLVADARGFPVGQLWVDVARKAGIAVLWAFRVMPPFQNLGLGSMLLICAEQLAARERFAALEVGVEPWNASALRLYQRRGFEHAGEERNSYETEDGSGQRARHTFDVCLLRKLLRPR